MIVQKWKDDLKINNYFSLVCNEMELLMLNKKRKSIGPMTSCYKG